MAFDGSLVFDTLIDQTGFNRGARALTQASKKLGFAVAAAFAIAGIAVVKFGKQAVELASDLQEVQNVVDTVFGEMSKEIDMFAKTAVEKFGLSELSAKEYASTIGAMLKPTGLATQQIAEMAKVLTGATGGMASFFNKTSDIIAQDIQSFFAGSAETMLKYGLVATVANLEQSKFAISLNKSWKEMSQAEQQLVRYNYLVENLGYTFNDFEKTQDSFANQQRILNERWKEFLTLVGTQLIQTLTPVLKILNSLLASLTNVTKAWISFYSAVSGQKIETQSVADGIAEGKENQEGMTKAVNKTKKAVNSLKASFDKVDVLQTKDNGTGDAGGLPSFTSGENPVSEIAKSAEEFTLPPTLQMFVSLIESLKTIDLTPLKESLSNVVDSLKPIAGAIGEGAKTFYKEFLLPLAKYTIEEALPNFFNSLANAINSMTVFARENKKELTLLLEVVASLAIAFGVVFGATKLWASLLVALKAIGVALTAVITFLGSTVGIITVAIGALIFVGYQLIKNWDLIKSKTKETFGAVMRIVSPVATWFYKSLVKPVVDMFLEGWEFIKKTMVQFVTGFLVPFIIDPIRQLFTSVWSFVSQYATQAWEIIKALWLTGVAFMDKFIIKPLVKFFRVAWTTIKDLALNAYNFMIETLTPFATWVYDNVITPVKQFFSGLWDGVKTAFTLAFEFIGREIKGFVNGWLDIFDGFLNSIIDGVNFMIGKLNTLSFVVPDWVPDIGGQSFGFNLDKLGKIKVPRLAEGAVIPPNSEFLAVLGDQKQGTNIETPLATMVEAFRTAMREEGNNNITINVKEKRGLGKYLKFEIDKENNRQGRSKAILGGV